VLTWNGQQWVSGPVGGGGFVIDVRKDYGTDAAAFNAAFAALPTVGGFKVGALFLSAGDYNFGVVSGNINGRVEVFGTGDGTRILYSGASYALGVNAVSGSGTNTQGFLIRNLQIDCQGAGTECLRLGQTGAGNKSAGGTISSIRCTGATLAGMRLRGAQILGVNASRFESNPGDGIFFDGAQSNNSIEFTVCSARFNGGRGVYVQNASGVTWLGGVLESNDNEGLLAEFSAASGWVGLARFYMTNATISMNVLNPSGGGTPYQIKFETLDGVQPTTPGTTGSNVFDNCFFSAAGGGGPGEHGYFLGGTFVFRTPRLSGPENTSSFFAPDCAAGPPPQTRIHWIDWRGSAFVWHSSDIGLNVVLTAENYSV